MKFWIDFKRTTTLLTLLIFVAQTGFAAGLEETDLYKANPKARETLTNYWQAFVVAKTSDQNPGKVMAAQIRVSELEDALSDLGFTEQNLDLLREEAQAAFVKTQQRQQNYINNESYFHLLGQLEGLNQQNFPLFLQSLKAYGAENISRESKLDAFITTLDQQAKIVNQRSRFHFTKMAVAFYLLSEGENFIDVPSDIKVNFEDIINASLSNFVLEDGRGSPSGSRSEAEIVNQIIKPTVNIFVASGMPEVSNAASKLLNRLRDDVPYEKKSTFKIFSDALKARRKTHISAWGAPIITASVATMITVFGYSSRDHWPAFAIWGMAIYLAVKDVLIPNQTLAALKEGLRERNAYASLRKNRDKMLKAMASQCAVKLR